MYQARKIRQLSLNILKTCSTRGVACCTSHKELLLLIRLADILFESPNHHRATRAQELWGMSYPGAQRVVSTLLESWDSSSLWTNAGTAGPIWLGDVLLGIFGNSAGD